MTTKVKPILPKTSDNLYEYKLAYYQLNKDEVKPQQVIELITTGKSAGVSGVKA